jgi:hypothetical protein
MSDFEVTLREVGFQMCQFPGFIVRCRFSEVSVFWVSSDLTCHPPMFSNNLLIEIKKTNVKITSIYTMNGINKNQQTI